MWLLKSQLNQNQIVVYHKFNGNFKNHTNFLGTKKKKHKDIYSITPYTHPWDGHHFVLGLVLHFKDFYWVFKIIYEIFLFCFNLNWVLHFSFCFCLG
jgi:hypothetical protein